MTKTIQQIMADVESAETSELIRHLIYQTSDHWKELNALPGDGQFVNSKHKNYQELKEIVTRRHYKPIMTVSKELDKRFKEYAALKKYLPILQYLEEHNIIAYLENLNKQNKSNQ